MILKESQSWVMKYKNTIRKIKEKFNCIQIYAGCETQRMGISYVYVSTRIEKHKLKLSTKLCI